MKNDGGPEGMGKIDSPAIEPRGWTAWIAAGHEMYLEGPAAVMALSRHDAEKMQTVRRRNRGDDFE